MQVYDNIFYMASKSNHVTEKKFRKAFKVRPDVSSQVGYNAHVEMTIKSKDGDEVGSRE